MEFIRALTVARRRTVTMPFRFELKGHWSRHNQNPLTRIRFLTSQPYPSLCSARQQVMSPAVCRR